MRVQASVGHEDGESTLASIVADPHGFYYIAPRQLGELCALILGQAEVDGATQIKLHYGKNRMIYTLDGTDYDMVPMPPPSNVDFVRALAAASRTYFNQPGSLRVTFADSKLDLRITHHQDIEDPYFQITGFSGRARRVQSTL
ncbi:MAG: hypothetical protein PVI86_06950 [Phycisphaerae bacterium]|jgi:hypothetical protein